MSTIFIHPTANVSDTASIGAGTKIWINAQIREQVNIGKDCIISKDTYIDRGVSIGNACKIQNGVSVYSGVTIADEVFVGPNATFTNDKIPRAFNEHWQITATIVAKGSSIGANATIVCGITLGDYCMVAAGSVVTRSVPAYTLVAGNPARPVCHIDKQGNKIDNPH